VICCWWWRVGEDCSRNETDWAARKRWATRVGRRAFSSHWHQSSNLHSCSFDHRTLVDGGREYSMSGAALGSVGQTNLRRPSFGQRQSIRRQPRGRRRQIGSRQRSALGDVDVIASGGGAAERTVLGRAEKAMLTPSEGF